MFIYRYTLSLDTLGGCPATHYIGTLYIIIQYNSAIIVLLCIAENWSKYARKPVYPTCA